MRIGNLFSGYGGFDLAVMGAVGGSVAWHVEFDKHPSKVLDQHWPGVPNHGDVTAVDWATVEPVDILTGGFPCQGLVYGGEAPGTTARHPLRSVGNRWPTPSTNYGRVWSWWRT